jgi:hypothetical protein
MLNFELFTEAKYDKMFARFTKGELERICCTLGSLMANRINLVLQHGGPHQQPGLHRERQDMQAYNSMLNKIDLKQEEKPVLHHQSYGQLVHQGNDYFKKGL